MTRLILTVLMFVLVQSVLMGVGILVILVVPALSAHALQYMLPMVGGTAVVSIIASFLIAPSLRARFETA
jgi:hypothetical protein